MNTSILTEQLNTMNHQLHTLLYERAVYDELGVAPLHPWFLLQLQVPKLLGETIQAVDETALYAVAAVHAAFQTHDRVHTHEAVDEKGQLTVLAGDHFSGIHYQILAKSGHFPLIFQLSKAISQMNEEKTELFYQSSLPIEEWLTGIEAIELQGVRAAFELAGWREAYQVVRLLYPYGLLKRGQMLLPNVAAYPIEEQVAVLNGLEKKLNELGSKEPRLQQVIDLYLSIEDLQQKDGAWIVI